MRQLPDWVKKEIRENMTVVWFGRRAKFEIVEEVSEAIFRVYIVANLWLLLYAYTEIPMWSLLTTFFIVSLLACNQVVKEIMFWRNEIYVVASDEINGGGRIYKFFGWLSKRTVSDPITHASPTIVSETTLFYRIWGKLTSERMERVHLSSINNTYLDGRRISPQFRYAIRDMGGYKPSNKDSQPTQLAVIKDITYAYQNGHIDKKTADTMVAEVLRKNVYT